MDQTENAQTLIHGGRIFTGEMIVDRLAVLVEDGIVRAVVPETELADVGRRIDLQGGLLVPGFVDLQVNGGGGVLFNETPTEDGIAAIADAHRQFGVTGFLPTLITDSREKMVQAAQAVRDAIAADMTGCLGIHLEGPYLAPSRKGAHRADLIRTMDDTDVDFLLDLGIDTVLVTLAPDVVQPGLIRRLADGGIIVSLGHSDATYDQVAAAVDAGAACVTHLFNAMSPLDHRAPGMVGGALDFGALSCGIIADGHHVHAAALKTALRAKTAPGHLFFVSDAMPTVGDAGNRFELNGRTVARENGRLTLDDGTLAGSDLDMASALRFGVDRLDLTLEEALRMASLYPAQVLRRDDTLGRIAPGFIADFVRLDGDNRVGAVWNGSMQDGSGKLLPV